MRKSLISVKAFTFAVLAFLSPSANSFEISLEDWVFNIDGAVSEAFNGDLMPTTGDLVDGLGTLSLDITGAGTHSVIAYLDFEIFEDINTFFNESGSATGTPEIGQSWEIDEPGFFFGDIVDNALGGSLDNSNGVPAGSEDDTAFAIGWDFALLAGDVASIDFVITDLLPSADFFLTQTDPDVGQSLYFYSTLDIATTGGPPGPTVTVPEPPLPVLLVFGALGILSIRDARQTSLRPH